MYLKDALQKETYGTKEFKEESVVAALEEVLEQKSKTEFVFNILIYADFSCWGGKLDSLVDYIEEITDPAYEQNRIVFTYNPILTICLACQHLTSIGEAKISLLHRCEGMTSDLLDLGASIIGSIEDIDQAMTIFMDKDFQDRSVFHLITLHQF